MFVCFLFHFLITHITKSFGAGGRLGRGGGRGRGRGRAGLDSTSDDDTHAWEDNMGKWAKMAMRAAKAPYFFIAAAVSNRISEQLDRVLWSMQKKQKPGEVANLAMMIFERAARIQQDLQALLDESAWSEMSLMVPEEMREAFIDCVNRITMRVNCDFERRIIGVIHRFPYRMFWFAYGKHDEACPMRKTVASEILDPATKEINACKIRNRFRHLLEDCVKNDGKISFPFWALWRLIAEQFVGDNQEIEGIMNLIKAYSNSCPGAAQVLIDARCGNKKSVGLGSRDAKGMKWSQVQPRFEELVDEAVEHFDGINDVLGNMHRFTPPIPILRDVDTTALRLSKQHLSPKCLEWASSQNLMFQRDAKRNELLNLGSATISLRTVVAEGGHKL